MQPNYRNKLCDFPADKYIKVVFKIGSSLSRLLFVDMVLAVLIPFLIAVPFIKLGRLIG